MEQALRSGAAPHCRPVAAALGVFDGVHLGHRQVLAHAVSCGSCHVVSFAAESMPQKQGRAVQYIYRDDQKRRLLKACGAENVTLLPFGEMQSLEGEQFCREILRERFAAETVVAGEDFRFGRNAACTAADLRRFGERYGFAVEIVPQVRGAGGQPVSSSEIRHLLEQGEIPQANALLGTAYQIYAPVQTGQHLGSTVLGIPTANQHFAAWQCIPRRGVYAAYAETGGQRIPAITNIGVRPTVTGGEAEPVAETHLIGWEGELVGEMLPVTLCSFLRAERPFASLDALGQQIRRDIESRMALLPQEEILSQD